MSREKWVRTLWNGWVDAVSMVQPETVIRWQRTGFRLFWTWKSPRKRPGCDFPEGFPQLKG